MDDQRRRDQGMSVRRAVLGDPHVDQATADTSGFTADFQDLITRYAWGEIWARPGLDRRTRSCITLAMLLATPAEGYAGCCEAIAAMDLRAGLGSIAAPTLVVAGADDPATPPAHAEAIVAAIPAARLEVVAGAAHLANIEQPQRVTRLLLDHLSPSAT